MSNIIQAIVNFATMPESQLVASDIGHSNNRVTQQGKLLELFVRDLFTGVNPTADEATRELQARQTYSYLGNASNPPDMMVAGGPAIEVKKFGTSGRQLQLNSSHPKDFLYSDNRKITNECRTCEEWTKKTMIYAIGQLAGNRIERLWLIHGDCYFAESNTYERIERSVSETLESLDLELAETEELARVNAIDPRGISNLRIRGMWITFRPEYAFDYLDIPEVGSKPEIISILRSEHYENMPPSDKKNLEQLRHVGMQLDDVQIENPNNPARMIDAKLIRYRG